MDVAGVAAAMEERVALKLKGYFKCTGHPGCAATMPFAKA